MNRISEIFSLAWAFKVSLLPVLFTYLLFDLPAIIRRITRRAYVPIYFMFFPLGHSDSLYAQYFNEDNMFGVGEAMSRAEKENLRTRIRVQAVLSMIFATVLAPWLCGFLAAFYLTREQFSEFIWFLMVLKTVLIINALYELHKNNWFVDATNSFKYLIVIYATYLALILRGITKSYDWTSANLTSNGFFGTLWGLIDYAYIDIFINVIVVALGTWAITTRYTNPNLIVHTEDSDEEPREQNSAQSSPSA